MTTQKPQEPEFTSKPCSACLGRGYFESMPVCRDYRFSSNQVWKKDNCRRCGGSGIEPEPKR
jgi:hypothetical protein